MADGGVDGTKHDLVSSRLSAGRSLLQRHSQYGYRRGGTFESPKVPKSDLGLRPKNPTRRYTPPGKPKQRLPGAGLDDAYKVDF